MEHHTDPASSTGPRPEGSQPEEQVLQGLRALFLAVQERSRDSWADLDLSMAQLRAFFVVARSASLSVGAVGRELGIGLPAASHIVERLVQAGLVERRAHAEDRRVTICTVSEGGRRLLEQTQQGGPQLVREWLRRMDAEDVQALARGLGALRRVIERVEPVAATAGEGRVSS